MPLIDIYSTDSNNRELYIAKTSGRVTLNYNGGPGSITTFTYAVNTTVKWYYLVLTYDGTNLNLYINGTSNQNISKAMTLTSGQIRIGTYQQGLGPTYYYFVGTLDEPRISNIARSAAWIATEFNNQKNGTSFYQISSEHKLVYNLQYWEKIIIDHKKISVSSDLLNYQL